MVMAQVGSALAGVLRPTENRSAWGSLTEKAPAKQTSQSQMTAFFLQDESGEICPEVYRPQEAGTLSGRVESKQLSYKRFSFGRGAYLRLAASHPAKCLVLSLQATLVHRVPGDRGETGDS